MRCEHIDEPNQRLDILFLFTDALRWDTLVPPFIS